MQLAMLDFLVIGGVLLTILLIGMAAGRKGSGSADDFFLGGRNMPWWLLGTSMVATTFSADTPNLVTDLVRQQGVSGNWAGGLSAHRHGHRFCLRPPLAPIRRAHRHRVLRIAIRGEGRCFPAWVQGGLLGPRVQRPRDGHREFGRHQARQHPAGLAGVDDLVGHLFGHPAF